MNANPIPSEQFQIVQDILRQYLPATTTVWIFGSRATATAKPYSDLDLAIDLDGKPLPLNLYADLAQAFTESDLPYKVDIIDWNSIDNSFQEIIKRSSVIFQIKSGYK